MAILNGVFKMDVFLATVMLLLFGVVTLQQIITFWKGGKIDTANNTSNETNNNTPAAQ